MQSETSSPNKVGSYLLAIEQYSLKPVTKPMDGQERNLVTTLLHARHGFTVSALSRIMTAKASTKLWHSLEKRNQAEQTQPLQKWYFITSSETPKSEKSTVMALAELSNDGTRVLRMLLPNGTSWVDQKFTSHYLVTALRATNPKTGATCAAHHSPSPSKHAYCAECYLLVLTHSFKHPKCQCLSSTVITTKYNDSKKQELMTVTLLKPQSPSAKH